MLPPSDEIATHTIVSGENQHKTSQTTTTEKEIILRDDYEITSDDQDEDEDLDLFAEEWEEDDEECAENGDIIIGNYSDDEMLYSRTDRPSRAPYQPSSVVIDLSCADFLYDSSDDASTEEDTYGDESTCLIEPPNEINQSIQTHIANFQQNFRFNNQAILRKFNDRDVTSIQEALKIHKERLEDIKEKLLESGYNSLTALDPTLTEICEHELALRLLENPMIFSTRNDISLNTNKRKSKTASSSIVIDDGDFIDDSEVPEELPTPKKLKKTVKNILILSQEEKEIAKEIVKYISKDNYEMVKKYHKQFLIGKLSYGVVLESKLSYYIRNRELQIVLDKERKKLKHQEMQSEERQETLIQQETSFSSQSIGSHTYKFPEYAMLHQKENNAHCTTLYNYNRLQPQKKPLHYLVLVPKSNIEHFSNEYRSHFLPEPFTKISIIKSKDTSDIDSYHNGGMLVMTYDRCLNMLKDYETEKILVNNTDILAIDEAHVIKNKETVRFMQFSKFKKALKILVTGTPLQNNIGEMFNLIQFIEPNNPFVKVLEPYFQSHFVKYLAEHKPFSKDGLLRTQLFRHYFKDLIHREVSIRELELIQEKKNDFIIEYTLNETEKSIYKEILDLKSQMGRSSFFSSYFYERVCLDCCSYFFQSDNSKLVEEIRATSYEDERTNNTSSVFFEKIKEKLQKYSYRKIECSRIRILRSIVSNIILRGEKAVIFTGLICYAPTVKEQLEQDKKVRCEIYSGELTDKQRSDVLQKFRNGEKNALIISKNAGGVGIDLTTAQHVILFNLDFNYSKDDQAIFRLLRKNQQKAVTIYRLACQSSIDDKLLEIQQNKKILHEKDHKKHPYIQSNRYTRRSH
nr:unnamed protein product [Naegleria fowleri]